MKSEKEIIEMKKKVVVIDDNYAEVLRELSRSLIPDVLIKAIDAERNYLQGIIDALSWVLGDFEALEEGINYIKKRIEVSKSG